MAAITMQNLVKKYDDGFPAVNDVSIDIADGDIMGIIGMMLTAGLSLRAALLTDLAFVPGDLIKALVAALIAVAVHRAFPRLAARS